MLRSLSEAKLTTVFDSCSGVQANQVFWEPKDLVRLLRDCTIYRHVRLVVNDRKFSAKTVFFSHTKPASSNNPRSYDRFSPSRTGCLHSILLSVHVTVWCGVPILICSKCLLHWERKSSVDTSPHLFQATVERRKQRDYCRTNAAFVLWASKSCCISCWIWYWWVQVPFEAI